METTHLAPPSWVRDLHNPPVTKSKSNAIPDPPGYTSRSSLTKPSKDNKSKAAARKAPTTEEMDTLKLKKAWELAIAPAKQLPMNAIGMYMTGNSLQIFSIMMVFMLFKNPATAIFSINDVFTRYETEGTKSRLVAVKLVYIAMNLLMLGLGIWKVNGMGLLPTTRSDWLAWETIPEPLYRAVPARPF